VWCVAGIDEAGRGCLAGPVIAAAVILDPNKPIIGLTDSKKLTERKRRLLASQIRTSALAWSLGRAEASEIDRINILEASLIAMQRAFNGLEIRADFFVVDGIHLPILDCPGCAVVQGDLLIPAISAASILAKVARDEEMQLIDRIYPGYDFAIHKGYPTKLHKTRILESGITPQHRKTFKPIKNLA
jgi:ribonuclease HII